MYLSTQIYFMRIFFTLMFLSINVLAIDKSMLIRKFELKNCINTSQCIKLSAAIAQSGELTPLLSLHNVKMSISDGQKNILKTATFGYLDLKHNRLVLRLNKYQEMSVNLNNLNTENFNL